MHRVASLLALSVLFWAASPAAAQSLQDPEEYLGHGVGADFKLAPWSKIADYMTRLGKASPRVNTRVLGRSTEGRPFLLVEISSAANIKNRAKVMADSRKVADPRLIKGPAELSRLQREAKTIIGFACSLHSNEVAASQMSMELAYQLASSDDPEVKEILENCVILLFPSQNPDGNDKIRDWYEAGLGKPWEGGRMPWLYQKYGGHDNNRDWFMLNLKEIQHVTKVLYSEWAPTIYHDIHQMGNSGGRFFVPPFYDPVNPNLDPVVNQWLMIIGGHMSADMLARGKRGVITGTIYDNWWAGGNRTTPQRHNVVALLTEAASANIASPVFQRKSQLRGGRRGMLNYDPAVNFPDPWPGGWWRLRDIVDYELIATRSLALLGARYRGQLINNQIAMGRKQINLGARGAPFAWLVLRDQRDPVATSRMLWALRETGIEMHRATAAFEADGQKFPAGTIILYASQPFRPHLKDMMERQHYPTRTQYPGGPAEAPYDMAGWTFPLQMGVSFVTVRGAFKAEGAFLEDSPSAEGVFSVDDAGRATRLEESEDDYNANWFVCRNRGNEDITALIALDKAGVQVTLSRAPFSHEGKSYAAGAYYFAGPLGPGNGNADIATIKRLAKGRRLEITPADGKPGSTDEVVFRTPRIALYQPWTASMDEGWTRYIFEQFAIPYTTIHDADIRAGGPQLRSRFDAILLPSDGGLLEGVGKDRIPPKYAGGLGRLGVMALQEFAELGGTLIANDRSCDLLIDHLKLPVTNLTRGKSRNDFYCAGSILRSVVDPNHPLGFGMPRRSVAFFTRSQAFKVHKDAWAKKKETEPEDAAPKELARRYPTTAPVRYAESLLLESGWIHKPELIAGSSAVVECGYGRGRVILFGFRVQHRAQPHGSFRLLFNALLRPATAR